MSRLRLSSVVVLLAFAGTASAADDAGSKGSGSKRAAPTGVLSSGVPSPGDVSPGPAGAPSGPPPLGDGTPVPKTGLEPLNGGPVAIDGAAVPPSSLPTAPGAEGGTPSATPPPQDGALGPLATTAPATAAAPERRAPPTPLLVGGGLLLIAGAGWIWTRLRNSAAPAGAASWVRVPEAGLFGPDTPSLSDGWIRCAVDATDRDPVLAGLLGALADRRPVLVVARAEVPVPPVRGHAVHRAHVARPGHVAQVLEALDAQGEPSVVLLVDDDPATARALAEALPADTAGVVLHAGPAGDMPGWPSVVLSRDGEGWAAHAGTRRVPLGAGLDGFRPRGA